MADRLDEVLQRAQVAIQAAQSPGELEAIEIQFLGRKGELTEILRSLSSLPLEERKQLGAKANDVKLEIGRNLEGAKSRLGADAASILASTERVDVTEPGIRPPEGHLHLVTETIREISEIFNRIGFARTRYPEVEWDYYAFEALNMPPDHPARDEWETFFMDAPANDDMGKMVLTPHATSGTARNLTDQDIPIRSINIQKTYRRQIDITHVPMFHQFDGLYVDKDVSLSHLVGVLDYFAKEFFGPGRKARLRPFHFRFTEPSFEFDISCGVCGGTGQTDEGKCRTCKLGWLELGGAGMLHPSVLKAAGLDPSKVSGLAFGWGVERSALMKAGVELDDLRVLYKNDLRFLEQF